MKSIQHKRNQVPQLQIFFLVGGFGRSIIIGLLRTWTDLMTSCLLHLVFLFLTSLGLGDSHLVILPLCSLVLFFFVINFILCLVFLFVSVTSACFVSFCIKQLFEYTSFLLIKKKSLWVGISKGPHHFSALVHLHYATFPKTFLRV